MRWSNHIKLGNQKIKMIIDATLPKINVAPIKVVKLRLWISLFTAFLLLAQQEIIAGLFIIIILFLDGLDGSIARKNNTEIHNLDAAADRYTEFLISACFLQINSISGILLLILSTINGFKSPFFEKHDWPSFPVIQISLVLLIAFIFN